MAERRFKKDPAAVLDYAFSWLEWLEEAETIVTSVVTVEAGITKDSDTNIEGIITIWLSGGTAGTTYTVASKITTSLGRTEERSILIRCEDR